MSRSLVFLAGLCLTPLLWAGDLVVLQFTGQLLAPALVLEDGSVVSTWDDGRVRCLDRQGQLRWTLESPRSLEGGLRLLPGTGIQVDLGGAWRILVDFQGRILSRWRQDGQIQDSLVLPSGRLLTLERNGRQASLRHPGGGILLQMDQVFVARSPRRDQDFLPMDLVFSSQARLESRGGSTWILDPPTLGKGHVWLVSEDGYIQQVDLVLGSLPVPESGIDQNPIPPPPQGAGIRWTIQALPGGKYRITIRDRVSQTIQEGRGEVLYPVLFPTNPPLFCWGDTRWRFYLYQGDPQSPEAAAGLVQPGMEHGDFPLPKRGPFTDRQARLRRYLAEAGPEWQGREAGLMASLWDSQESGAHLQGKLGIIQEFGRRLLETLWHREGVSSQTLEVLEILGQAPDFALGKQLLGLLQSMDHPQDIRYFLPVWKRLGSGGNQLVVQALETRGLKLIASPAASDRLLGSQILAWLRSPWY